MIVNAGGGGLGPMIVPRISGRTITSTLMRDAAVAAFRPIKRYGDALVSQYTPKMVEMYRKEHGKTPLQYWLE